MKDKTDVLIVGGGITGCAAAKELVARGVDVLVLEKDPEPGGLTRSIRLADAVFDYTGHYLSLSSCSTPADIPHARQNNDDWNRVRRRSVVYLEGTVVPAPLQYNIGSLPAGMREECIRDFRARTAMKTAGSFEDYLRSGFGEALCRIFLLPYNRKLLSVPLSGLSAQSANRFFPQPDEPRIEEGYARREEGEPQGYNSYFWYPKGNGIGLLAEGLAEGLECLETKAPILSLELSRRRAVTPAGAVGYERLLSTMPLKSFCGLTDDPKMKELGLSLGHNRVLCLNVLLEGELPEMFRGCHWVYVPEAEAPIYRMGVYSNIPDFPVPASQTALYLETAVNAAGIPPGIPGKTEAIFSWLERKGWVAKKRCLAATASWIECGYVHFTPDHGSRLADISGRLQAYGVGLAGRYGLWDYMTMEESILSGVAAARKVAG